MKRILLSALLSLTVAVSVLSQPLQPFDGCPGVSVAVTRPGLNLQFLPHQIYLIDDSTGDVQASGDPIDLQLNAVGLNMADGFLYGMHQTYDVVSPSFTRIDKNGKWEIVGTIPAPEIGRYKSGIINTAAGTMDDEDNYYFTAVVINFRNILAPPELYSGKIEKVSELKKGERKLAVKYKKISTGSCTDEFLMILANPLTGVLQDIAYNPNDKKIYTYFPGMNNGPGKLGSYSPNSHSPSFSCMDSAQSNPATADLSGLFIGADSMLYILTTDGNFYAADVQSGLVQLVAQTTLPLMAGNLRGDMASCAGKKKLMPFTDCPDLAVAVTRPGINSTGGPHQIYTIKPANGMVEASGHPIDLQINGFGLNTKDGFLYGMHEVSDIFGPTLARVDKNGDYVDLNIIPSPPGGPGNARIINTAAATMDGNDNYYFTAVVIDTTGLPSLPRLYLGRIKDVSKLEEGDPISVDYDRLFLGDCLDEILQSISNPANGLLQDIAYNPKDGRIYTYIQRNASPSPGKLASFRVNGRILIMDCINRHGNVTNPATADLSGMHGDKNGQLYILTTDGKYYRGNPNNGSIVEITQTDLPLQGGNLRGDMASCVKKNDRHDGHEHKDEIVDEGLEENVVRSADQSLRIGPNPVAGDQLVVFAEAGQSSAVELRIIDANGITKQTRKLDFAKGMNQLRLDVGDLQKGVFGLVISYPNGKISTVKFVRL